METIQIKTEDLKPYEKNTKKHDARQIQNVAESINQFGFIQPVVVDKDNVLIIGPCRLEAAKVLGLPDVPAVRVEDLTPEQIRKLRILDNKLNESEWDLEALKLELNDLDLYGFDVEWAELQTESLDEVENVVEVPVPEVPEEPKAAAGDIWLLGRHRLMCGDSTNPADVKKLLKDQEVDAVITDPPYNVDYETKDKSLEHSFKRNSNRQHNTITNDKMNRGEFIDFLTKVFENMSEALKPGGAFYIWHAASKTGEFLEALENNKLETRQILQWVKNNFVLGRQDYQWMHEPCLYGWKEGAAHYFINSRSNTTVFDEGVPDIDNMKKEDLKILLKTLYDLPQDVIREAKPQHSNLHPTMKPVPLIARELSNSTRKGETVLDLFGGSGTTLMAAEQLDRVCYCMEYDPHYCEVIIKRWEEFTGEKALKI